MVVPPLKKDSSRENKDREGKKKQKTAAGTFGMLLDSEQEKVKAGNIVISSTGYTKDAKAASMFYQSHEYN